MKLRSLLVSFSLLLAVLSFAPAGIAVAQTTEGRQGTTPCTRDAGSFLGIPRWSKYLDAYQPEGERECYVEFNSLNDVWKIALAIFEILLTLAGYLAVGAIVYGGFVFMFSQGNSQRIQDARNTILYAAIGLVIAFSAKALVNLLAGTFS